MSASSKFAAKKLYEVTTGAMYESESTQSMWAYSVHYEEKVTSGRMRMTIQKISASEVIEALGGSMTDETQQKVVGYTVQAFLERWSQTNGWMHVIDWMGNPSSSFVEIENQLYEMFKSFVTGTVADIDITEPFPDYDPFPPQRPGKQKTSKTKNPESNKPKKEEPPLDFEWI